MTVTYRHPAEAMGWSSFFLIAAIAGHHHWLNRGRGIAFWLLEIFPAALRLQYQALGPDLRLGTERHHNVAIAGATPSPTPTLLGNDQQRDNLAILIKASSS